MPKTLPNQLYEKRTVTVVDTTGPESPKRAMILRLRGSSTYIDAGATVQITTITGLSATITGSVNTAVFGEYNIDLQCRRLFHNAAITKTRTVNW